VALERKSAAERFTLSWLQEDAAENLSLAAKLKADFGLELPEFNAGDDFDPRAYLAAVATMAAAQPGWQVLPDAMTLGFFSFAKFLMYRDLDTATWPPEKRLDRQALIAAALQDGFEAREHLFPEDADVDQLIPVDSQRHVVDADSSQSLAIEAVRRGENLVIQGPPGTGKSQTITNVIAAAIADGKKVLFISEKMAALEVVNRRLKSVGLGPACLELHSHHANKRKVLEELKATRDLGKPRVEHREQIIHELSNVQQQLNSHSRTMHQALAPCALTPYQILGQLARLDAVQIAHLPDLLQGAQNWSPEDFHSRQQIVEALRQAASKVSPVAGHPWRGVCHPALLKLDAQRFAQQLPTLQAMLARLQQDAELLAQSLSAPAAQTIQTLHEQITLAQQLASAPSIDRQAVASSIWDQGLGQLHKLVECGARFSLQAQNLRSSFAESAWTADWNAPRQSIAAHGDSLFRIFNSGYRAAIASLKGQLKTTLPSSRAERLNLLDSLIEAQQLRQSLGQQQTLGADAFGSLWLGEQSDWAQLQAVLGWMAGPDGQGRSAAFRQLYAQLPSPAHCADLAARASASLQAFEDAAQSLLTATGSRRRKPLAPPIWPASRWPTLASALRNGSPSPTPCWTGPRTTPPVSRRVRPAWPSWCSSSRMNPLHKEPCPPSSSALITKRCCVRPLRLTPSWSRSTAISTARRCASSGRWIWSASNSRAPSRHSRITSRCRAAHPAWARLACSMARLRASAAICRCASCSSSQAKPSRPSSPCS
jgi:hypothetical protein